MSRSHTVSSVLDRFFAQYYASNPVNATFTGVHAHDHTLPDWSKAARRAQHGELQALHAALDAEVPRPARRGAVLHADALPADALRVAALLAEPALLDAELARANLDVRMAELSTDTMHDRNPALWTGEAIFGAASLMVRDFAPVEARLPALGSRLDAIPDFLADMRTCIAGPVPSHWRDRAVRECLAAGQLLSDGLRAWLAAETGGRDRNAAVLDGAHRACQAFEQCRRWLVALPAAGNDAYASPLLPVLLARGHLCDRAPEALLRQAEQELPMEQQRLSEMCQTYGGSWDFVQQRLADNHPTAPGYLDAFAQRWQECRAWAQEHDAVTWPDWPLRYVPIPRWARQAAPSLYWLFYRSPAPFDRYTTYDYVVTPVDDTLSEPEQQQRLRACNHSVITLNHVVHHGAIGHHVQNWHATHRSRSRMGTIAAVDCASRIGMFLGGTMAEGWACYATDLMDELGFLTPLEQVAQQHSRVRMLVRAIVDLRLHSAALPFPDAIRFYQTEAGMTELAATGEATKNSMFPCTALMYWLGTSTIHALRDTVHRQRGAGFSLKTFHDELLSWGAIPVPLVASLMTEPAA